MVCWGMVTAAPLIVPVAVPPTKLKKLPMLMSAAVEPAEIVGLPETGNLVALQVEVKPQVGPVQFSAPITTFTVRCAVEVPLELLAA